MIYQLWEHIAWAVTVVVSVAIICGTVLVYQKQSRRRY